jgi:hypothetical protein
VLFDTLRSQIAAAYLSAETRPRLSAFGFREIIVGVATGQRFLSFQSLGVMGFNLEIADYYY